MVEYRYITKYINQREILKALDTIKAVCEASVGCSYCPFYLNKMPSSFSCGIAHHMPYNWSIDRDFVESRAFKEES